MFLVVPAPSSCCLLLFGPPWFFYLILQVFFSVLSLFLCPISHFLFPQVLLFKVAHCPAPSPSGELEPLPPSAFSLFAVSFCLAFSPSLRRLCTYLGFLPSPFASVYSCFPFYYGNYLHEEAFIFLSHSTHINILSSSTIFCLSKLTFIS